MKALFKSILCLHGDLPSKNLLAEMVVDTPIFAADGAANALLDLGIVPQQVLGDLDSFDMSRKVEGMEIISLPDQNYTDSEKSLIYLKEKGLFPTLILGVYGGEIDHSLHSLSCIQKYSTNGDLIFCHPTQTELQWGFVVKSRVSFMTPKDTLISLLPLCPSLISTHGLKWELSQMRESSVRNRSQSERVEVNVHEGAVLVIITKTTL